jgi:predicted KAP-like P-loop ATPase
MKNKSDSPHPSEWLSADKPIETREEDALGRRGFSEALASAIRGWSGRDSLVIALYGVWGSGKSSIKNMMIESLATASPNLAVIDFNPWQRANRPQLSTAFFDELGIALGKGDLGTNEHRKQVLNRYRRWASRLRGGREFAKHLRNTVSIILFVCAATLIGSGWIHSRTFSITIGLLILIASFLSISSKFVDATITFFEAGVDVGAKSLGEIKAEVAADLRKMDAPILAILDDLDRLTPAELLEVFQLIKANGDFPNLIYLVLCERTIVETNIAKALNVVGRDYLEKIVQVAFDVPMIDVSRVHQVLFERLDSLLSAEAVSARFSEKRWVNMFRSSIHSYFSTLRDVNRFISTLSFHVSALSVDDAFEVNPIDLIGIEVIRSFEPGVYKALQSSKGMLTTTGRPEKREAEAVENALASIVGMGREGHRDELRKLIRQLFPTVEWALGGSNYINEYERSPWYRELRICSSKVFDRYFRLAISEKELSQGSIRKLLQARGDRAALRSELETLHSRGLLDSGLEELAIHQDEIESEQVEPFITAIFDVADLLSDEKRGMFEVPVHWRVGSLVQRSMEKFSDTRARSEVLTSSIEKTNGLSMAVHFVALIDAPREGSNEGPILPETELVEVRRAAVNKISGAAASGALAQHPKLAILLGLWRKWGKNEDVGDYIETLTMTKEGTLQLLRSLVVRSLRQQVGDYAGTERYYMRRIDIETLISMDILDARVGALPMGSLSDEDRRAVRAFQKAMERRSSGKSDDDPFARD